MAKVKYFLETTKKGVNLTIAEKAKGRWIVAVWHSKPKTYKTSGYITRSLDIKGREIEEDIFTLFYLCICKTLKFRAS